jgi:NAD(P)-dependent dehydrogenase (short-subunit alcohol dehydrogenase family)
VSDGFAGKVAVVIGGTSGIGRAIALGFGRAGARVIASSRRTDAVAQTAGELAALGVETIAQPADVQSYQSLTVLCDAIVQRFGTVNTLVVSSGVLMKLPTLNMTECDFERVIDINLAGVFRANQVFGRQMIAQGGGAIVNIASIAGIRGIFEMSAYSASKAGVISLTETLACEWAPYHVRVNAIAPGPFRTPLNEGLLKTPGRMEHLMRHLPMKRMGELEEIVGAALFLGGGASSYVTGETIRVDGGLVVQGL